MSKKRGFTLIEVLVTVTIVVIIAGASVLSLGAVKKSSSSTVEADEFKRLIEELKSYSIGPHWPDVKHYVLIIQRSGSGTYCNRGSSDTNQLGSSARIQYMICSTDKSDLATTNLNDDFDRVRAGHLENDITISAPGDNPLIFNVRTFDSQLGYRKEYFDSGATADLTVTITKNEFSKNIIIDPINGLVKF